MSSGTDPHHDWASILATSTATHIFIGYLTRDSIVTLVQSFSAKAGQTLSFDTQWALGSPQTSASIQISGPGPGFSFTATNPPSAAWQTFSMPIQVEGVYTLKATASAAVDRSHSVPFGSNATLYLDNVQLIPEPSTLTLALLGVAAIGVVARLASSWSSACRDVPV